MMKLREKVSIDPKKNSESDLILSLIVELIEKYGKKKLVSYEIGRFFQKTSPETEEKGEMHTLTGREEVRALFEPREEKDGG